jgi:hypothetical protein
MITALVLAAFLLIPPTVAPAAAQSDAEINKLRQEIEGLKDSQEKIERDIEIIKNVLRGILAGQARGREAPEPAKPVVLSVEGKPFKGERSAKLTLVDFSDYQ